MYTYYNYSSISVLEPVSSVTILDYQWVSRYCGLIIPHPLHITHPVGALSPDRPFLVQRKGILFQVPTFLYPDLIHVDDYPKSFHPAWGDEPNSLLLLALSPSQTAESPSHQTPV